MFEQMHEIERRYEEISFRLSSPEGMSDPNAYAALVKDYKELTPLIESWRSRCALQQEIEEEQAMLQEEAADPLFTDMVQQELRKNRLSLSALDEKLRLLLLPKDADDDKSIIMEIRAGTGGRGSPVCAGFVAYVYNVCGQTRLDL